MRKDVLPLALVLFFCLTSGVQAGDRPNILFIMADDHTSQAFQTYNSRLEEYAPTPNIHRIAEQGAVAENVFATNSICVPSRATILTGQYSHENNVYTLRDRIDPERSQIGHELQDAGYQTSVIGKWHLKSRPSGFNYWEVLPGQGRYFDPVLRQMDGSRKTYDGFSADVIADRSLDWLKNRRTEDQPFFLNVHFKASHESFRSPPRNDDMYKDVILPQPPTLWEDKSHRSPGSKPYGFTIGDMAHRFANDYGWTPPRPLDEMSEREKLRRGYQAFVKQYLRSVAAIDQNVGRLLEYLQKNGLKDNTVVIYTSDQGYFLGEHNYIDKRWMYEESIRMPFHIRLPGEIKPGTRIDDLIGNHDFAPLMLDYAGVEVPDYMQGRSFRSNLRGNTPEDWRDAVYYRYWMHGNGARRPAHYGIRTRRYKLIFFYGLPLDQTNNNPTKPGWELYDLKRDPHEMDNVYGDPAYEDTVQQLKKLLLEKKKELGDTDASYPALMKRREQHW